MRVFAALFFTLWWCACAAAQPYVSAFGGVSFAKYEGNRTESIPFGPTARIERQINDEYKFRGGMYAGGAVGYEFDAPIPGNIRTEIEGSFKRKNQGEVFVLAQAGPFNFNNFPAGPFEFQRAKSTAAMVNLIYASPRFAERISVYAGGGIGAAKTEILFQNFTAQDLLDVIVNGGGGQELEVEQSEF